MAAILYKDMGKYFYLAESFKMEGVLVRIEWAPRAPSKHYIGSAKYGYLFMMRLMCHYQKSASEMEYWSHFSFSTRSAISSLSLFIKFEGTSLLAYVNEIQRSHVNQGEIWRKLWKEMTSLFRVAGCAGLTFLMWKGSKQSYSALLRKIDVRMWEIKSASKGNTIGSRRDETAVRE